MDQNKLKGKKFLLVHSSAELYGSDRCLLSIVQGLVDRGAVAHVAIPESGELVGELEKVGARVHILDTVVFRRDFLSVGGMAKLLLRTPWSVARLTRLIKRERYDLVHTNTGVTIGGAIAARLSRIPHVWHFRDIFSEFGLFLRLYEPLVLLLSNHFIYITEAVANQFSLKGFKKKGVVIHDGIPVEEYSAKPETPGEKIVLTSVGRLAPYKGQDVLLKAIANVIRLNIDLETYIVGEVYGNRHEFREELNNLAASLDLTNKVHFMGFYENVQPFLEKCNIFILPSTRQEPLGIVMLEAMAARRAVIATDGGGAREIITDGEDGLLVPPGDSHRMAEAIIRLVKNPEERRRLATFGYEKVNKKFSEKVMVDAVLALFENIIIKKNNSEV